MIYGNDLRLEYALLVKKPERYVKIKFFVENSTATLTHEFKNIRLGLDKVLRADMSFLFGILMWNLF